MVDVQPSGFAFANSGPASISQAVIAPVGPVPSLSAYKLSDASVLDIESESTPTLIVQDNKLGKSS